MDKGEEFNIQCEHCLKNSKIHVNDVRAQQNNKIIIGGVVVGLIITIVLWRFLGAVATLSATVPAIIWKQEANAVTTFNKYMARR